MNAQLGKKPVFYYDSTRGEIRSGLPEQFPAPYGFQKIVCNTAHEAEVWSARQRKWEEFINKMTDQEREMVEGPIRDQIRSERRHLMANARNNFNRDFLRRAQEESEKREYPWKSKRESYLHSEGFERGH